MVLKGQKSTPYIADIIARHGIKEVVICPGSRNAPLTLAFARHGDFTTYSMVDERAAGYFGLGRALQTRLPVVIICTSGTAVLNLAPAVAEAYYQGIPLFVITADRPSAWIGQQDGQAIRQENIFKDITTCCYQLKGELYTDDESWFTQRSVNEACHQLLGIRQPVHLNITFTEPLYDDSYERTDGRYIEYLPTSPSASSFQWSSFIRPGTRILIIAGQMNLGDEQMWIQRLAQHPQVVVVAENVSNISAKYTIGNLAECATMLTDEHSPDVIVHIGGAVVAKKSKQIIRSFSPQAFIRIEAGNYITDTFQKITHHITGDNATHLQALYEHLITLTAETPYQSYWKNTSLNALRLRDSYLLDCEFSDIWVFNEISTKIPSGAFVHLANSMPVRYAQVFNDRYQHDIRFFANRGTSGIDGSTSTAVGFHWEHSETHILISGDLSFQYDNNGLFHPYLSSRLKIIIINNSGGNIFGIIDGPSALAEKETYFETRHRRNFKHMAGHYDLNYFTANDKESFSQVWNDFMSDPGNNRPSVLEIKTEPDISASTFKNLYKHLQQK